jgi:hypothetical protein
MSRLSESMRRRARELTAQAQNWEQAAQRVETMERDGVKFKSYARSPRPLRGERAVFWLVEQFRKRPEWLARELIEKAGLAGISRKALYSPEVAALPIGKEKRTDNKGRACWVWFAKVGWPKEEKKA